MPPKHLLNAPGDSIVREEALVEGPDTRKVQVELYGLALRLTF
jgi:hypothetical protein